jgi:hypothetical protein
MTKIVIVGEMYYSDLSIGGGPMPGGPGGIISHPIAPGGERPTHPIAPGGPPLGIWGGGGVGNYPDAGFPAPQPPYPGQPPGIWGPTDPRPTNPIVLPPVTPGGPPVVIWGPTDPRPTNPIVLPPPPPDTGESGGKPPPPNGGWGYHPEFGWGYFPAPIEPGPKV